MSDQPTPDAPTHDQQIAAERQRVVDEAAGHHGAEALSEAGRPPSPEESILYAEEVVAGYVPGVDILTGTNLHVREGELVGIIGPNGAGKSTLIKAMFGLVDIRSGRVVLRDDDITGLTAHELVDKGVGYVPQTKNVFPSLTIEENLQMGIYLRPKQFAERFEFVAGLFPKLLDRRKQRAGSLSGGERQMVAMGRALMMDPGVLFLDEPSAGLSPANQGVVFHRVKQINDAGVTIVMVEQNAQQCLRICDRGYVLDQGRDAYTGTGDELLHDPKVVELYLGTLVKA
ncbi:ABC transporter ATP-binding protein [Euzebya sp.]|uniref:ABC transporter ATP-binding protein n=1 Tax=Euzebya sp. TaxID=1971409 RepID=UPI003516A23D